MWTSFLVAMGGVLAIGVLMAVVAWMAGSAVNAAARRERSDSAQLQLSLDRIADELRQAQHLARSTRQFPTGTERRAQR